MNSGSTNLGISKHQKSGKSSKSPKAKMAIELMLREEEKELKSRKKEVIMYSSIGELFAKCK